MSTLDGGDHNAVASGGEETCRRFSLDEIRSATNNFDDALVIGNGGFGKVYKGSIDDGATTVAIKRLQAKSKQGEEEFLTEVELLSKLQHNHLVPLIGHCNGSEEMILVYEYMAHGTLADHLYKLSMKESGDSTSNHHLAWEQRLGICIGAAQGLDYLHTGTNQAFIHRDVKTTNILLDEKWVAKIADFGLTKALTSQSATHVSTNVKGTFGYFDLDYYLTGKLTMKSDVYAFGVVLLEVLCGRPPVDTTLEDEPVSLVVWAQQNIKKGKLEKIIDPFLGGQISPHCLKYFVKLANDCLQKCSKDRPTMSEVVTSLELALDLQGRGRKEGIITKMFQGGALLVSKGMNGWWSEKKEDDGSKVEKKEDDGSKVEKKEDDGSKVELSKDPNWEPPPSGSVSPKPYRQFSLAEIRASTHDFNMNLVIEVGRLGENVYKGWVDDGTLVVAIKRLRNYGDEAKEFKVETEVLSTLCHPNVEPSIGFCNEGRELFLVYNYMVNGSLRAYLHGKGINDHHSLWKKRLKICIDVAQGLQYLRTSTQHRFIHTNVTSSNILLDSNWVAKISCFALFEKVVPCNSGCSREDSDSDSDSEFWGPEDVESCVFEPAPWKCTIDSFGCLLLEVLGIRWPPSHNIREIDPKLKGQVAPECFVEFLSIALSRRKDNRTSMNKVVERLEYALKLQKAWEKKRIKR